MRFLLAILCFFAALSVALAQFKGGAASFPLLDQATSAQQIALGGRNTTHTGADPYFFLLNPSLSDSTHLHKISFNYHRYFADIQCGAVAYAMQLPKYGILSTALQYMNYGSATAYDISGNEAGQVSGNEFVATAGYAIGKQNIRLGVNLKVVGSQIAGNNAYALGTDWAATYIHPEKDLRVALQVRHIGYSIVSYSNFGQRPVLPLDPRIGVAFKPKHMPIRIHAIAHALHRLGRIYDDPNTPLLYDFTIQERLPATDLPDRIMRHLTLGAELLFSKKIIVRAGYSHQIKQELRFIERSGLTGFSWGAALRTKKYELSFARAYHYVGSGRNTLSLVVSMERFWKRK